MRLCKVHCFVKIVQIESIKSNNHSSNWEGRNNDKVFLSSKIFQILNPFSTSLPILYPLKTSENLQFSDDFSGYRRGKLVENGLSTFAHFIKVFFLKFAHSLRFTLLNSTPYYTKVSLLSI